MFGLYRSLLAGGSEGDRLRGLVERGSNKPGESGAEGGAIGGLEHPPELPPRLQANATSRSASSDTPGLRLSSNSNFELCTSHPELEQGDFKHNKINFITQILYMIGRDPEIS